LLNDDVRAEAIERDWREADLDERRSAMLGYCEKLTSEPSAMTEADVQGLRAVGFSDADILAIVECTAYYAYANRIADGLGVSLEEDG
jgi:uncharacterized peroxidase-related enzyme